MKFTATKIPGVWVVDMERHVDERGWFARTWCTEEFTKHGLNPKLVQCNASFNRRQGTLRGMHYQAPPHAEAKLVRCPHGALFDVALDLRPTSPSFKQWVGVELTGDNGRALYVPEGCAHGFQTLTDNTEAFYQMSEFFHADSARGVRWDDPAIGIHWPVPDPVLSDKDSNLPLVSNAL